MYSGLFVSRTHEIRHVYDSRYNKGSWLLPVSVVPFLGPALYLLLRPPVPAVQASSSLSSLEEE